MLDAIELVGLRLLQMLEEVVQEQLVDLLVRLLCIVY